MFCSVMNIVCFMCSVFVIFGGGIGIMNGGFVVVLLFGVKYLCDFYYSYRFFFTFWCLKFFGRFLCCFLGLGIVFIVVYDGYDVVVCVCIVICVLYVCVDGIVGVFLFVIGVVSVSFLFDVVFVSMCLYV